MFSFLKRGQGGAQAVKHFFVVNPVAGQGLKANFVRDKIIPACEARGVDYEVYYTKAPGDGMRFVKEIASKGNPVRFYACGGDGTLYDVVNGAYGYDNVEIAVVPLGSGNDWIRLFGEPDVYLDIDGQLDGTVIDIDCIKAGNEIAINQASMGFDAEACAVQAKMKNLPGVAGHLSYIFGGLYCAITKVKNDFEITVDGKKIEGPFIFAVGCNSRWYGSGVEVAPFAVPNDGMLDFVIMKRRMPWLLVFKVMMVDWRSKGLHIHHKDCEYIRGKKMTIKAKKPCAVNVDGECQDVMGTTIEVVEKALKFVIPAKSPYFMNVQTGKINSDIVIDEKKYLIQRGIL